jgi:hypothetical protein
VKRLALVSILLATTSASAYEANGIALGSSEAAVTKSFPNAAARRTGAATTRPSSAA